MNHIISIIDPTKTWCNEDVSINDFHFKTLDQAALAYYFPDTKPPCNQCINAVIKNFNSGNDYELK